MSAFCIDKMIANATVERSTDKVAVSVKAPIIVIATQLIQGFLSDSAITSGGGCTGTGAPYKLPGGIIPDNPK